MTGGIGFRVYCERVPRIARPITLESADRLELERWVAAHGTPQQVTQRCQIILAAADGRQDQAIAEDLQLNFKTVARWRGRCRKEGVDSLWEVAAGRGRKPTYSGAKVAAVIERTLQSKPPGATHWSCRTMAQAQRLSKATGNRIWQSHRIKPPRTASFKLSGDPRFLEKLTDVVGLYLNPPAKALVLCLDEKSQIQALDRTQPGLPLKRGRCGTMTRDYQRPGPTTLFAALELAEGKVVGECHARQRHPEFLKFLQRLDEEFPEDLKLHVVMDHYGTHKHPRGQRWLERHPRFIPHFIPTSSSWLNRVERWFGELTGKRIRRGVFVSVADLQQAMAAFLAAWKADPQPFVWTATVAAIVEKLGRCRQTLEQIKPGCTRPRMRKTNGK